MKILSEYQDYYDHLTNIYGIDENVILDRREFDNFRIEYYNNPDFFILFLCGFCYEFFHKDGKIFHGKRVVSVGKKSFYSSGIYHLLIKFMKLFIIIYLLKN
jgi:hypothetical protein